MAKKVAARTLDFSNVKESSGVNPKHKDEGEYLAKVSEVRDDPAKDGEAMWCFIIKPVDDASAAYPYYVKLVDNQLWKLRNLFIAAGMPLAKKAVKIDPNKVVGKQIGIVLEDDEYEGKLKSVISAVLPKEELSDYAATESDDVDEDDDDEEEEAPAPKARAKKKPAPVEEDDDDEEEDEEEEPAPVSKRTAARRKAAAAAKKAAEEDDEDEDDEEEEPAPRKRKAAAKAAPAKKRRKPADDDDDDLDLDL